LLRYESTKQEKGDLTSIDDYIERMDMDQKDIYFLVSPNRETALTSPYLEHLNEKNIEVLLGYSQIDQFVFENLSTYRQKDLVSIEKSKVEAQKKENIETLTQTQS
jgi:HSP90 family molecular chaperone